MKIFIIVCIGSFLMLSTTSCSRQETSDPEAILSDTQVRKEIMDSIAGDHILLMEMMEVIMESEHGKMMVMQNQDMMQKMVGNMQSRQMMMQSMMQMAQDDSAMRYNLSDMMTGNRAMMTGMMQMMQQKGMMSSDCMDSGLQNLKEMNMDKGNKQGMMGDHDMMNNSPPDQN